MFRRRWFPGESLNPLYQPPALRRLEKQRMQTIVMKKAALRDEDSLCRASYWAHIQRGFRESEETVFCCFSKFRPVPFKVADCTDFNNKTVPTREQMERIALIVQARPARKRAGFVRAGFAVGTEEERVEEDESGNCALDD